MQTRQLAHMQIAIPADCLSLVADLVTKLGGRVTPEDQAVPLCLPAPEVERGGKTLRYLRLRSGLTQKQVADFLGLPQSHVSEFERDKRSIPYKHAQKLARMLRGVPSHFMRPNKDTLEAMREADEGKGKHHASAEDLFKDLGI